MRQHKPTTEELQALETERNVLLRLLTLQVNGRKADAVETVRDASGGSYQYELWGATDASGGLLVRIFSAPGQGKTVNVTYFDAAPPRTGSGYYDYALAYERLNLARTRAYQVA